MFNFESVELVIDDRGIAFVNLMRPEKHNAMNGVMIDELTKAAEICASNDQIRAVVLGAKGKSFCAGGDLNWMREQTAKDRAGKKADARKLAHMLFALNNLPKPLIGRVQGNVYGGGVGMMSVCDIVIAHKDAMFGLTETKLGLVPATIGPFVVRRLGEGFARQVFFTAKTFDATLALRFGLISRIEDDLDAAIEQEISAILKTAPGAVADAKKLCQNLAGNITIDQIEMTIDALADRWESHEAQTGIDAFFNKTVPPWRR